MSKFYSFALAIITWLVIAVPDMQAQECVPVLVTDSDNSLCAGDPLNLTVSVTLASGCDIAGYQWNGSGTPGGTSGSGQITVGSASGDYSVSVSIVQDGTLGAPTCPCIGTETSNVVSVNANPPTPTISALEAIVCEGTPLQLQYTGPEITGAVYNWSGPNGFTSNEENPFIAEAATDNSGTYNLVISNANGCTSPASAGLAVTVNATPDLPLADDVETCPTFPATLTATSANTVRWYDAPLGGTPLATGGTYETEPLTQTTIFYAEAFNEATNCVSERVPVTAIVLPPIPSPVARDTIVCEGDPATLTAIGTGTPGNIIRWYNVAFGGTPLEEDVMPPASQTYTTNFGLLQNTTFFVAEFDTLTGCESPRTAIQVKVLEEIPEPIAQDVEICLGDEVTLTAEHGGDGTSEGDFYWFNAPVGGELLGVGQNFTPSLLNNSGVFNFYVEERFNDCTSPTRDEVTVTIFDLPANPVLNATTICEGTTSTLTATATGTVNWFSDANGNNQIGTGTSIESPVLNQNTTFYAQVVNPATGCLSEIVAVTVIVQETPENPTANDVIACESEDVILTVSGSGNAGSLLNLYTDATQLVPVQSIAMPPSSIEFNLGELAGGTYTYYIEEVNPGTQCASGRTPVSIEVLEVGNPPIAAGITICIDESAELTANSSGNGSGTFRWYADAALTQFLEEGVIFTVAPTSTTTYYVTESTGTCETAATPVTVTVNNKPNDPVIAGLSACSGESVTLTANSSGGVINWYADPTGTQLLATGNNYTTETLSQTTTFYVQETAIGTGCLSNLVPVTVSIAPAAQAPIVQGITICQDDSGELSATGSGNGILRWYDSADSQTPLQSNGMPPATATLQVEGALLPIGTTTFYVEEDNGTCPSPRVPVNVTVIANPTPPTVATPPAVCFGESAVISPNSTFGGDGIFNFYDETGTNLLATGATFTTGALTNSVTFQVTEQLGDCESEGTPVFVQVNPLPDAPLVNVDPVCGGESTSLTATPSSNGTINWYGDASGTNLLATGTTYQTSELSQNTTVWVEEVIPTTGCSSGLIPVEIPVLTPPAAPSAVDITVCLNEEVVLIASGSGTGSLLWFNTADPNAGPLEVDQMPPASASFTVNTVLPVGTTTYYVAESNGTCVSERTPITITVLPIPSIPSVTGITQICAGERTSLQASSNNDEGVFNWYNENQTELLFTGSNYETAILTQSLTLVVTQVVGGCESEPIPVFIQVNQLPDAPVVTEPSICEGETALLSTVPGSGGVIRWYDDNNGENLLATGNQYETSELSQTTTFWVEEVITGTGCSSGLQPITVTVAPAPAQPSADNITVCSGDQVVLAATGSGTGSILWYDSANPNAVPLEEDQMPPTVATFTVNATLPVGNTIFYVAESNGQCESDLTAITVTVLPTPLAPSVTLNNTICEGEEASLVANSNNGQGNSTFNWYNETQTSLLFTGATFNTGALTTTTTFLVTEVVDGCESQAAAVLVQVNPKPVAPQFTVNDACEGESAIITAVPGSGGVINWYEDPNGENLIASGTQLQTPILNQNTTFWVEEVITGTGCSSDLVPVNVNILPAPAAPSAPDVLVCLNEPIVLTASGSGSGSILWFDSADPDAIPLEIDQMPPATASYTLNTALPVGTTIYYVAESNGTCTSSRTPISITVKPIPSSPIISPVNPICEGESVTVNASSSNGGDNVFNWYDETQSTLLFTGNNYVTGILNDDITLVVTEVVDGCESQGTIVFIQVNDKPQPPVASPVTVCEGEPATLVATPSSFANQIEWFADANGQEQLFVGDVFITEALSQNTTFWVRERNISTTCVSDLVSVSVEVQQAPDAPAVQDLELCTGAVGEILAVGSGNGILKWYDSPNSNTPIQIDNMPPSSASLSVGPFNIPAVFTFYVEEENLATGCSSERVPVLVRVKLTPGAPVAPGIIVCEGESATLTASSSDNLQADSFNWYDNTGSVLLFTGSSFETPELNETTTYQVSTVVDGCESLRTSVTVTVNPQPTGPSVQAATVCSGSAAVLQATPSQNGYILNWYADANASTFLASGVSFTTQELTQNTTFYVRELVPGSGCVSALVPVTVSVLPIPSPPSSTNITLCENEVGEIIASGSGVGSINWYDSADGTFPIQINEMPPANVSLNVGPFVPGVYVFYVEESNGSCTSTRTPVSVTVLETPDAPISSGKTICKGESTILEASSTSDQAGDFYWYDQTGAELLFTGSKFNTGTLDETTSYLIREVKNGCFSPTTLVTVIVEPAPAAPTVDNITICEGEAATIQANGTIGNFINWYSDANGTDLLFTGATFVTGELEQSTTFWVAEVVVGSGCTSELKPVQVTVVPQPPAPSVSSIFLCENEVGELIGSGTGSLNSQLQWYNVATGGVALQTDSMGPNTSASFQVGPFAAGTYTFYLQEDNQGGCSSERVAVEVVVSPKPAEPSVDDLEICEGEVAVITAPGTGVFNWYDAPVDGNLLTTGLTLETQALDSTTSFYVTQEVNGCESDREEVVVTVNALPATPQISNNSPICEGDTLFLTGPDLPQGFGYIWSGPNGFSATIQSPFIANVNEADHQGFYTLSVVDFSTGCESEEAETLVQITRIPASPSLSSNSPICAGEELVLTASEVPGVSEYLWILPSGDSLITTSGELIIAGATEENAGLYTVQVAIDGCNSPAVQINVVVIGTGTIPEVSNNGPLCEGETLELKLDVIAGAIYTWSGPDSFVSTDPNPVIENVTLANAGIYEVVLTFAGCPPTSPASTIVEVVPGPVIAGLLSNSPVCQGDSITLFAPNIPNVEYSWTGPNGFTSTEQNPVITGALQVNNQGVYTLTVTDTLTGCSTTTETEVFVDSGSGLVVLADNDGPACEGENLQLSVSVQPFSTGYTFEWSGPNGFTSDMAEPVIEGISQDEAGIYTVLVNGNAGCLSGSQNTTTVEVQPGIVVDAGPDQTIELDASAQLNATGADIYSWNPAIYLNNANIPNPTATPPLGVFEYVVTGLSVDGCSDMDTVVITVEPGVNKINVYDLFTPNGDGVNDTWVIDHLEVLGDYEIVVFNRGGIRIFNTRNYNNDWAGTYNGRDLPEGTYWYVIRTDEEEFKGAITIIR